jgi:hypothetical protein
MRGEDDSEDGDDSSSSDDSIDSDFDKREEQKDNQ